MNDRNQAIIDRKNKKYYRLFERDFEFEKFRKYREKSQLHGKSK
jgi:hypothetical protein